MRILLYANSAEKARLLLPWVRSLSSHFMTEVAVQATREASAGELAAADIFRLELPAGETLRFQTVKHEGEWPEEGIAQESLRGDYNLVLLAPAGRKGFIRFFYGSMVAKVIRRVSTSVLVARSGVVPPRRILACVSGSRHSLANVRAAAQLGVVFGSQVTIMMVISQLPVQFGEGEERSRHEDFLKSDHPLAAHLRAAQDLLVNLGGRGGIRVCEGLVVDEILDELETSDHDLLVVGTHRAEDYDPMYEDITSELIQKSERSTLVVGLRADLV